MPTMDVITEYIVRYGFQVLGAALVFAAGALIVVTHDSAVARKAKRRLRLEKGTVRDITK